MLENPLIGLLPQDQANLVLILVINIPISYLLSFIYNKYIMLALTMTLTMGFQSLLFPTQKWFLWIQQQIVYLLVIFVPRKIVGRVVIIESFLALTAIHLRRLYLAYGQNGVDITGIFMMQLFNYIGLAYNYQNGAVDPAKLNADQFQRRVVEKPSYLTYLGYVNFLPACFVGPCFEYADYDNYLHRRGDYIEIPNTVVAIIKQSGVFLKGLTIFVATSYFTIDRVVQPQFEDYNYGYQLLYMMICIVNITIKYLSVWSLGMISLRATGLTYNPAKNIVNEDKSITYDFAKIEMNHMYHFYITPSFKIKGDNWNICIVVALRRYVYENIYNPADFTDQKKRRTRQFYAQLFTVVVSALWHGLYPGYYMTFTHWVLGVQITHQIYRLRKIEGSIINRLYTRYELIFNQIQNLYSLFMVTYFGMPINLMTWDRVWIYLKISYFIPYILLYIGFYLIVVKKILGGNSKKQKKKIQQKQL